MLKENWRFVSRIQKIGDNLIIVASFFSAYYGRESLKYWNDIYTLGLPFEDGGLAPLKDYFIVLVVAALTYSLVLHAMGAYGSMRLRSSVQILGVSLVSSAIVFVVLAALLFTLKVDLSRSFIGLFTLLVALSFTVERFFVLRLLRFWRRRGRNFRNILVCGVGRQAVQLGRELSLRPELGIGIRCFADLKSAPDFRMAPSSLASFQKAAKTGAEVPVIYGIDEVARALGEFAIDEVIFTDVVEVMPLVTELISICSEQGVRTTIAADLFSLGMVKSGISYFGGMPLIHFQTPPGDHWTLSLKRVFDVVVAALLLIVLSPLFAVIAGAVKMSSPGPVLFRQKRIGLNGRIFSLYKFRSMYADAEQRLPEFQALNEMKGPVFKIKDDPRITPVGRVLRRFSLDELPQLWNVLRGDMSLVGPRPPVPGEVSMYERRDRRRLSMRPGLTCTWQVEGRNEISDFDAWVRLDLDYIDNWSFGRDLLLLLRTIPTVMRGTGR